MMTWLATHRVTGETRSFKRLCSAKRGMRRAGGKGKWVLKRVAVPPTTAVRPPEPPQPPAAPEPPRPPEPPRLPTHPFSYKLLNCVGLLACVYDTPRAYEWAASVAVAAGRHDSRMEEANFAAVTEGLLENSGNSDLSRRTFLEGGQ
jgi:hypothetical protein